jgi:hypothetical protein
LKADLGFARSTFSAPSINDPQLTEGLDIIEVEPATRNAWYGEASYDLLKDVKLDEGRSLSVSLNLRQERIEPQFGTLGATVTADQLQTRYGLNAAIAAIGTLPRFGAEITYNGTGRLKCRPKIGRSNNIESQRSSLFLLFERSDCQKDVKWVL